MPVQGIGWPKDARTSGVAVLVIAFAKARLILHDFMELRSAAWPMRLAAEGWSIILGAALILIYWLRG